MECNPSYSFVFSKKRGQLSLNMKVVRVLDVFHTPFIESDIRLRLLSTSITRTLTCW